MFKRGIVGLNFAYEDESYSFTTVVSSIINKRTAKRRESLIKTSALKITAKKPIKMTKDMISHPSNFQHISHMGRGREVSQNMRDLTRNRIIKQRRDQNLFLAPSPRPPPLPLTVKVKQKMQKFLNKFHFRFSLVLLYQHQHFQLNSHLVLFSPRNQKHISMFYVSSCWKASIKVQN